VTSFDKPTKYLLIMELRFEAMFYCNLSNEKSDADHNVHAGHRLPNPGLVFLKYSART